MPQSVDRSFFGKFVVLTRSNSANLCKIRKVTVRRIFAKNVILQHLQMLSVKRCKILSGAQVFNFWRLRRKFKKIIVVNLVVSTIYLQKSASVQPRTSPDNFAELSGLASPGLASPDSGSFSAPGRNESMANERVRRRRPRLLGTNQSGCARRLCTCKDAANQARPPCAAPRQQRPLASPPD